MDIYLTVALFICLLVLYGAVRDCMGLISDRTVGALVLRLRSTAKVTTANASLKLTVSIGNLFADVVVVYCTIVMCITIMITTTCWGLPPTAAIGRDDGHGVFEELHNFQACALQYPGAR